MSINDTLYNLGQEVTSLQVESNNTRAALRSIQQIIEEMSIVDLAASVELQKIIRIVELEEQIREGN